MVKYLVFLMFVVFFSGSSIAQISLKIVVEWEAPARLVMGNDTSVLAPSFKGAQYHQLPESILPSIVQNLPLPEGTVSVRAAISNVIYQELSEHELQLTAGIEFPEMPEPMVKLMMLRHSPRAIFTLLPFGMSPESGKISKIESFTLTLDYEKGTTEPKRLNAYTSNSVLASGDWYKIYIGESGIYKLTYR
jgi:hypothetical protein